MNSIVRLHEPVEGLALPASRPELIRFLVSLCGRVRADHYLVARMGTERCNDELRIVASNWTFDTLEALGAASLQRIATAPQTAFVGSALRTWRPFDLDCLTREQAATLNDDGHREVASVRLRAGANHYFLQLSAAQPLRLDTARMPAAVMTLSYALSTAVNQIAEETVACPISERERECLGWVAEGKTTLDIATILGVSSNTINSYLAHVIQKLSARNRTMAIAVAIRSGII